MWVKWVFLFLVNVDSEISNAKMGNNWLSCYSLVSVQLRISIVILITIRCVVVVVGRGCFAEADLDAVRHDRRRHIPLRLLPAQHAEPAIDRRSQEPGLVWRRTTAVQPRCAKVCHAAKHAILGLRLRRVPTAGRILRQRCHAVGLREIGRVQYGGATWLTWLAGVN